MTWQPSEQQAHHVVAMSVPEGSLLHVCEACGAWGIDTAPKMPCRADNWHSGYEAGYRIGAAEVVRLRAEVAEHLLRADLLRATLAESHAENGRLEATLDRVYGLLPDDPGDDDAVDVLARALRDALDGEPS